MNIIIRELNHKLILKIFVLLGFDHVGFYVGSKFSCQLETR